MLPLWELSSHCLLSGLYFSILGFVVKGLLWLALIGLVLFVATAVWGWFKRKANV